MLFAWSRCRRAAGTARLPERDDVSRGTLCRLFTATPAQGRRNTIRHSDRSTLTALLGLCLLASVTACTSANVKVEHDHDPTASFANFKTFKLVPSKSIEDASIRGGLERMIADELARKGLTEVEDKADLLVIYDGALGSREQIATGLGYAVETVDGMTTVYTVGVGVPLGILVINLVDSSRGEVVWRGAGQKALKQGADAETQVKRLEAAVAEILASYPPGG
jgi:hypothetical protein